MNAKKLFKAIADFQQEVPVIHKDTQGYGYSYADLPAIFEVINPLLKKHNLGFVQPIEGQNIKTIVFHTETGETIESLIAIPENVQLKGMNDFQVLGSAITYLRRYAISSILGLITDKDTDASGEQVKPKQEPTKEIKPINEKQMDKLIKRSAKGETIKLSQVKESFTLTEEQINILNKNNIF